MTRGLLKTLSEIRPNIRPAVIFDVGANVGQSVHDFIERFPSARVYAFEPVRATFEELSQKFDHCEQVSLHQVALDASDGEVDVLAMPRSGGNRIIRNKADERVEKVKAMRLDSFCKKNVIETINILKIDTEGNDLNVLVGCANLLQMKRIQFIQVECTTSPDNRFHVQLSNFLNFLNPFGYRLFGLFEFTRQIYRTRQKLNGIWFCNAVFVREIENPKIRRENIN